jgi:hypothetical protein
MSKLDSGLFVMTPVDVQLESIARDAVKMFEGEARSAGIKLEFCVEESCKEIDIANVSLDPTRVLQILINLVTNAIKFTRLENIRHITVSLGISLDQPSHYAEGKLEFLHTSAASEASTLQADWEKGQIVGFPCVRCNLPTNTFETGIYYLRSEGYWSWSERC